MGDLSEAEQDKFAKLGHTCLTTIIEWGRCLSSEDYYETTGDAAEYRRVFLNSLLWWIRTLCVLGLIALCIEPLSFDALKT